MTRGHNMTTQKPTVFQAWIFKTSHNSCFGIASAQGKDRKNQPFLQNCSQKIGRFFSDPFLVIIYLRLVFKLLKEKLVLRLNQLTLYSTGLWPIVMILSKNK